MRRAAIILAAGMSKRFGTDNKLLYEINGQTMIRNIVSKLQGSKVFEKVVVVLGYEAKKILEDIAEFKVESVFCPTYAEGMAESIKCGLSAIKDYDVALFVPADMPYLQLVDIEKVALAVDSKRYTIATAYARDYIGVPTAFSLSHHFNELSKIEGDRGAKPILKEHEQSVFFLPIKYFYLKDIDTV
jgi:molybdenum cofactor cytidylyltransferase